MKNGYIVGIDSGTSMVKAALFDLHGNEVCVTSCSTPVEEPQFGWSEFDMDTDWNTVAKVTRELISKSGIDKSKILALGLGGKGVGLCFIDENGHPTRKGILWNDARCANMTKEWIESGKMEDIEKHTGNLLMTGDVGVLLPWMKKNEPEVLEKTRYFCLNTNLMCYRFTGNFGSCASDFYSQVGSDRKYNEDTMKIEGIWDLRDKFLPMHDSWELAGYITKQAAEETGLAEGTPVTATGFDVVGCTIGVGAIEAGQANIILGTTGAVMVNNPNFTPGLKGLQTVAGIPNMWLQLIAPLTGTPNNEWFIHNFTYEDKVQAEKEGRSIYALFDENIAKVHPGCNGVVYHPYMNPAGERAPFNNINARGNFFGLNLHSDRPTMLRAIYEGMAFSNKHCLDAYTCPITDIHLSGGGAKSSVWCQIFADVCNATISLPKGTEFGAKGNALIAACATGLFNSFKEASDIFCEIERVYDPIPKNVEIYSDVYEIYKQIPFALFPTWEARTIFLKKYNFKG